MVPPKSWPWNLYRLHFILCTPSELTNFDDHIGMLLEALRRYIRGKLSLYIPSMFFNITSGVDYVFLYISTFTIRTTFVITAALRGLDTMRCIVPKSCHYHNRCVCHLPSRALFINLLPHIFISFLALHPWPHFVVDFPSEPHVKVPHMRIYLLALSSYCFFGTSTLLNLLSPLSRVPSANQKIPGKAQYSNDLCLSLATIFSRKNTTTVTPSSWFNDNR
jgi:hypothetical protein